MSRDVRLAAAGLSLIAVCYGLARFAYGLFLPVLTEEFGLDGAVAGTIASSSYIGYCVAIVVAAAGTGLIAAAGSTGVLAVGVVIAGSSTGLASPPLADAVARWVTSDRADRVQTAVNAGTGLGVMVSGPVASLTGHNWRLAWFVFALTAVVVTIWIAVTIPRQDSASDGSGWQGLLPARWFPPGRCGFSRLRPCWAQAAPQSGRSAETSQSAAAASAAQRRPCCGSSSVLPDCLAH